MALYTSQNLPRRPTWLEVDLSALAHNVGQIRARTGPNCRLMAVVKANAYGHGAARTAQTLLHAGADQLAVATLSEAIELREAHVRAPILVLGYTPPWLAPDAVAHQVTVTVFDPESVAALAVAARTAQTQAHIHVKVNTGMNRLGLTVEATPPFLAALANQPSLVVEGIFTHFATSDLADKHFAETQFHRFCALLNQLSAHGLRPPLAHAANSAALLTMPHTHLNMVRSGIALYGLHPDADATRLPAAFRPALSWKAVVAQVLHLQPGESVSYGQEFVATAPTTIAVLPLGYADGFPRRPYHWGAVLIHGQPAPIVGRVCMDQTMVDVTEIEAKTGAVRQGDEVVLIGRQGDAHCSAEEVASRLQTNNYDVVSRIQARVPRVYL